MNNSVVLAAGTLALGAGLGYYIGAKRTFTKAETLMNEEAVRTRDFYERTYKAGKYETPSTAAQALGADVSVAQAAEALRNYKGMDATAVIVDELKDDEVKQEDRATPYYRGPKAKNAFADEPSGTDLLAIDDRQPEIPYVISLEEWMENEPNHNQISLTWFGKEQVLLDEREDMIDDPYSILGEPNLDLFGLASGDPNVVHIRHEMRDLDFEVTRATGSYKSLIAGLGDDLAHSEPMRRRKPRWDE